MSVVIDYQARLGAIQAAMGEAELDGLVVTRSGGITYVAGCLALWRTAVVIPREGDPELITVQQDVNRLLDVTWMSRSRTWQMADPDGFVKRIADSLLDLGISSGRVGFDLGGGQHTGVLSATEYLALGEALPGIEMVNGMPTLDRVMLVKDRPEIELLRRAAEIADLGMEAAFAAIAPGRTELEVAGQAEAAMRSAGNEFVWSVTGTEVGSGYRQSYAEGFTVAPSGKRIQRGDIVTVDVHPMYGGYLGDLALNAVLGTPTPEQQKLASAWQGVANSILEGLRPGAVISEVARKARRTAEQTGYGSFTVPFFGHGLGTDARIPHAITEDNHARLEANVAVEVLLQMTVPKIGGLRLETAVLITEAGHEPLNRTPIELRVIEPH